MLYEVALLLIGVSAFLSLLGLYYADIPIVGLIAGIFWAATAYGIANVRMYKATNAGIEYITYYIDASVIWLFGLFAASSIVYSLYSYIRMQNEDLEYAEQNSI